MIEYEQRNTGEEINKQLFFPYTENTNLLQISDIGLFSISKPKDAELITNIIMDYVKNPEKKTITEGTAGLGGNVINFSKYFKKVKAVENNFLHYQMLKNNISIFNLKNVDIIYGNYLTVFKNIKQDIIFLDPPWGGEKFKDIPYIDLKLSGVKLHDIVNNLLSRAELIVVKIPFNFNLNSFVPQIFSNEIIIRSFPWKRWKLILIKKLK